MKSQILFLLSFIMLGDKISHQSFWAEKGSNMFPLNILHLQSGMYWVKIIADDSMFFTKIVKQ